MGLYAVDFRSLYKGSFFPQTITDPESVISSDEIAKDCGWVVGFIGWAGGMFWAGEWAGR